jgi:hypothetical protein
VMLGSRSNIGCWINGNRKEFWLDLYRLFVYVGVTLIVAVIGKTLDLSLKASISLAPEVASPVMVLLVHE